MASIWTIASILCLIAAAIFLARENYDAAFVLAALGALAWILNYRFKIRETLPDEAVPYEDDDEGEDEDEDEK